MRRLTLADEFIEWASSSFAVVLAFLLSINVCGCAPEGLSSRVTPYPGRLRTVSVSEVEFVASEVAVGERSTAYASAMVTTNVTSAAGPVAGGAAGGFAAGLGSAIAQEQARLNAKILNQRFNELSIPEFIAEALRKSLVADLRESSMIESDPQDNSRPQAQLVAVVRNYGFGPVDTLTFKTKPTMTVQAMLMTNPPFDVNWKVNKNGMIVDFETSDSGEHELIWTKTAWTNPFGKLPSYTLVSYLDDPDKTKEAFTAACRALSNQLVEDLTKTLR
jgi:hypothetical protein